MPYNFELPPTITGKTPDEQIKQLQNYIYKLVQDLNYFADRGVATSEGLSLDDLSVKLESNSEELKDKADKTTVKEVVKKATTIEVDVDGIKTKVEKTLATKAETQAAKNEAIDSSNSITDEKLKSYPTIEEVESKITQTAEQIELEVVKNGEVVSKINLSKEGVLIDADKVDIEQLFAKNINMSGTFTATAQVYIPPDEEILERIKKHIYKTELIPDSEFSLYDFNANGEINTNDMMLCKRAMYGQMTLQEAHKNAQPSTVTIMIAPSNIAEAIKITGTDMWGRNNEIVIGSNGVSSRRINGEIVKATKLIANDITTYEEDTPSGSVNTGTVNADEANIGTIYPNHIEQLRSMRMVFDENLDGELVDPWLNFEYADGSVVEIAEILKGVTGNIQEQLDKKLEETDLSEALDDIRIVSSESGSSLHITDSAEANLLGYTLYGKSVKDEATQTIMSIGEVLNLTTPQAVYEGTYLYSETVVDGRNCVRFTSGVTKENVPFAFKQNTQYTVSFYAKSENFNGATASNIGFTFFYEDGSKSYKTVPYNSTEWRLYKLTSNSGKTVRAVGVSAMEYRAYVYLDTDTFVFNEGSTGRLEVRTDIAGANESQSIVHTLTEPLRGINDVRDEIDYARGKRITRVGIDGSTLYALDIPIETNLSDEEIAKFRNMHTYEGTTNISTNNIGDISAEYVRNTELANGVVKAITKLPTDQLSDVQKQLNILLGTTLYEVDPSAQQGIYCNGKTTADSVNSVTLSDPTKKYKRLKIHAHFPRGLTTVEFPLDAVLQGTGDPTFGNRVGGIYFPAGDNANGATMHYMCKMHFAVYETISGWTIHVTDSGWLGMGIPPVSATNYANNSTATVNGTGYPYWNQRHNSNYVIYKIVAYED